MTVTGIGIDLIEIERMRKLRRKYGEKGLSKVFAPSEIEKCLESRKPDEMLAGRFAVKEAVMKAIGAGLYDGVNFKDITIVGGRMEKPSVEISGKAKQIADSAGVRSIHISITHEKDYAAAVAVLEK